jgi:hypothetical protein
MKHRLVSIGLVSIGLVSVGLALLFFGARPASPPSIVDGWRIGGVHDCANYAGESSCALLPAAAQALDRRNPGHASIRSMELRDEVDAEGRPILRSGLFYVVVFHLADGSLRAIGAGYVGIDPNPATFDFGQDRPVVPLPSAPGAAERAATTALGVLAKGSTVWACFPAPGGSR